MPARIRCAHGARACEDLLLRDLAELRVPAAATPDLLREPIRIIVPSASLRQHLNARIVADAGRAVAGVIVQTLHGFARFVMDAAGLAPPPGSALFPLLVRHAAEDEAPLALLHDLTDGYTTLVGTVADLLDAGFEEAHADAIDELLLQLPLSEPVCARVRAVVRVAERTVIAMRAHGVARQAAVFPLARELIERDRGLVRARALLIHGFADATGVASDFIASLLGTADARIYLDQPHDPAAATATPAGIGFVQRFAERMSGLGVVDDTAEGPAPAALTLLRARGAAGEIRAIADRIRLLLDGGTPAESIGVVARNIATYAVPLRQHFGRLGIPFSAPEVRGPFGPIQRRVAALFAVLRQQDSAPAERWINALGSAPGSAGRELSPSWQADIRHALHTVNAARIADLAALAPAGTISAGAPAPVTRARRMLAQLALADAAGALRRRWRAWPSPAVFRVHAAHFTAMVSEGFSWPQSAIDALLAPALLRLGGELPSGMRLSYDDFLALLSDALRHVGAAELGGRGAGVRVLDVTAARGVTFSHLFIVGLNRDVFPRTIAEDPLVPDAVRRSLASLLPDLPIKQLGFEEERYLFAQLLSASPHVTLCWQFAADDGSAVSPSPLVDRLHLSQRRLDIETEPGLYGPPAGGGGGVAGLAPCGREGRRADNSDATDLPLFAGLSTKPPPLRPAHEHAVLAGLYGSRDDVAATLQVALPAPITPAPMLSAADAARIQLAVIDEHEGRGTDGLGPYYGLIGAPHSAADPRHARLFITTIENVARCPWKTFVHRILGVQPPPDALESLPSVTALVLGDIVHRALDRIVRAAIPDAPRMLTPTGEHPPALVPWPDDATVQRILQDEAATLAEESGVAVPGLVTLMVRHARAYLDQAKRHDWPNAGATVPVVGSEMIGAVQIADGVTPRLIYFKADRVDAMPAGLRLTDYKTGRVKRESLLTNVARGTHLQCAAYALGAGHPGDEGRYLYLGPEADDTRRTVSVSASDPDVARAFHAAAGAVLAIWNSGGFFPRFAEPSGSDASDCRFCDVRDACLRNDSEYRARFLRWAAATTQDESLPPVARAVLRGWRLRARAEKARPEARE